MPGRIKPIVEECKRQYENCLYSSTACYEVVKSWEWQRRYATVFAFILGSVTAWAVLREWDNVYVKIAVSAGAFVSGMIPSLLSYIKFDETLDSYKYYAASFKNLGDGFRQAAQITSQKSLAELEKEFEPLRQKMEELRLKAPAIPEWAFLRAKSKIDVGHYSFEVDIPDDVAP